MQDLTDFMSRTPFKNSTFRFAATDNTDQKRDFYYTPYQITNWHYDEEPDCDNSIRNFVHDISHIIDLYKRGNTANLLKVDFGWRLSGRVEKRSDAAIMTELRTIAIQEMLCRDLLGHSFGARAHDFWRIRLRKVRANPNFLRGRGAFDACVQDIIAKTEQMGVEGHLKVWKAACEFVKQHRDHEETYGLQKL